MEVRVGSVKMAAKLAQEDDSSPILDRRALYILTSRGLQCAPQMCLSLKNDFPQKCLNSNRLNHLTLRRSWYRGRKGMGQILALDPRKSPLSSAQAWSQPPSCRQPRSCACHYSKLCAVRAMQALQGHKAWHSLFRSNTLGLGPGQAETCLYSCTLSRSKQWAAQSDEDAMVVDASSTLGHGSCGAKTDGLPVALHAGRVLLCFTP